jgi:hypothetical protein
MFDVCTTDNAAHIDKIFKFLIISAVKNIDALMLARVWQEFVYRIDMYHVTRGAPIEHL